MADEGIFLVPEDFATASDATTDSIRAMTQAEQDATQIPHVTLDEILHTASVLVKHCNCPVDVVNTILEFAAQFATFQQETSEHIYGRDNMNEEYLRLDLPEVRQLGLPQGIAVSKCIFLVVECVSKDQGWASFEHELNGTYNGSCTWSELAVEKKSVASPAVGSEAEEEHPGDDVNSVAKEEVARVRVCSNVRASRTFRHHRKCFQDPHGVIQHIELGDSVKLVLRSQYPGWTNSAKYAKLTAFFALEFDEEFSFAEIPYPGSVAKSQASVGGHRASPSACSVQ